MKQFILLCIVVLLSTVTAAPASKRHQPIIPFGSQRQSYIHSTIIESDVYTYTSVHTHKTYVPGRITTVPLQPDSTLTLHSTVVTTVHYPQPPATTTIQQQQQPEETTTIHHRPHVTKTVVEVYDGEVYDKLTETSPVVLVTVTRSRLGDITTHQSHHHTTTIYLDEPEPTSEQVVDVTVTSTSTSTLAAIPTLASILNERDTSDVTGVSNVADVLVGVNAPLQSVGPFTPIDPNPTDVKPHYYPWIINPLPHIPLDRVPSPTGFPPNATCFGGPFSGGVTYCELEEKDVSGCVESADTCRGFDTDGCVMETCTISPGGVNATCHEIPSYSLRVPPSYNCSPLS